MKKSRFTNELGISQQTFYRMVRDRCVLNPGVGVRQEATLRGICSLNAQIRGVALTPAGVVTCS